MRTLKCACAAAALLSAAVHAQPSIYANGIVNAASSAPVGLPNASIAQGSIFSIYGQNMGPAQSPALTWPLKAEEGLGGVTVRINSDAGQPVFAILLFVSSGQINAVLPSTVPPGHATATVIYNGASSNAADFTVIQSSVGLLAWNQQGSGPGIVQNYRTATPTFNSVTDSARPGDVAVAWGTGLGPVAFNEKNPPVQSDLGLGAEVWVGGVRANVLYQGRSTAAGQDQLNFTVPNVTGCYVPVYVKVGGVVSNTVTMAIAPQGGMCQDSSFGGLNPDTVRANGLKSGTITLSRTAIKISAEGVTMDSKADVASASFTSYDWLRLLQSRGGNGVSVFGACAVVTFRNSTAPGGDPVAPDPLDAGASLTLLGPDGVPKTLQQVAQIPGSYAAQLSTSVSIPGSPFPGQADYYTPGTYQVTGPGGAQVGPFTASITLPQPMVWSNVDAIATVPRNTGLTINWTGGAGTVFINGYSAATTPQEVGASFFCLEQASRGTFTVPANVLAALPASGTQEDQPLGMLSVGDMLDPVPFTATGLDVANITGSFSTMRTVRYQ